LTRYMLDTNIISDLIKNPKGKAAKRIARVGEDNICTSIVVATELRYGCAKKGSERLLRSVEDLLAEIDVLSFGKSCRCRIWQYSIGTGKRGKTNRRK
jgi:tRNA(fMet)-specific endonuclease VapC